MLSSASESREEDGKVNARYLKQSRTQGDVPRHVWTPGCGFPVMVVTSRPSPHPPKPSTLNGPLSLSFRLCATVGSLPGQGKGRCHLAFYAVRLWRWVAPPPSVLEDRCPAAAKDWLSWYPQAHWPFCEKPLSYTL